MTIVNIKKNILSTKYPMLYPEEKCVVELKNSTCATIMEISNTLQ